MYRNKFTTIKRRAEKEYYSTKLEQAKDNLKETWKIIKGVINKNQTSVTLPDSFKYKNEIITNPLDISNKFNDFFVNIGPTLDSKIEKPRVKYKHFMKDTNFISDSIFIRPTNDGEIIRVINSCKNKSSSGFDNIPMTVIKYTGDSIAAPLAHICNLSFTTAHVPSGMKTAKVTPIFKCDARDDFSNYRPNFTASKLFENLGETDVL